MEAFLGKMKVKTQEIHTQNYEPLEEHDLKNSISASTNFKQAAGEVAYAVSHSSTVDAYAQKGDDYIRSKTKRSAITYTGDPHPDPEAIAGSNRVDGLGGKDNRSPKPIVMDRQGGKRTLRRLNLTTKTDIYTERVVDPEPAGENEKVQLKLQIPLNNPRPPLVGRQIFY